MRPVTKTVGAVTSSANSICLTQTPAGAGALTLNGAAVSSGSVTFTYAAGLTIASGGDDSNRTFTVVGTNANGQPVTEVITGPNGNTVTSTNFWLTVTSITISGAAGSSLTVGNSGTSVSAWAPMDSNQAAFSIGIGCVITGAATYSIEHTFDNVYDYTVLPTAFTHAVIAGVAANADGNYSAPIRAARVKQTAGSGSVTATFVQGMMP